MNLKPLNQHSEYNVLNWYALSGTGAKGLLVSISDSGYNPSTKLAIAYDLATQQNILSPRWKVGSQLRPATLGEVPVGITLYQTKEVNFLGAPLIYDATRRAEAEAVVSGMPVPILREGYVLVGSFSGQTPAPQKNVFAVATGQGDWKTIGPDASGFAPSGAFAEFLGPMDKDGYAVAFVKCGRV